MRRTALVGAALVPMLALAVPATAADSVNTESGAVPGQEASTRAPVGEGGDADQGIIKPGEADEAGRPVEGTTPWRPGYNAGPATDRPSADEEGKGADLATSSGGAPGGDDSLQTGALGPMTEPRMEGLAQPAPFEWRDSYLETADQQIEAWEQAIAALDEDTVDKDRLRGLLEPVKQRRQILEEATAADWNNARQAFQQAAMALNEEYMELPQGRKSSVDPEKPVD